MTLVATELPPLYAFWYTPYHALLLKLLDSHGPAAYIPCAPGLAQESVRNLYVTSIYIPLYSQDGIAQHATQRDEEIPTYILIHIHHKIKCCPVDLSHRVCLPLATSKMLPEMIRQQKVRSCAGPFPIQKVFIESGHVVWEPKPLPFPSPSCAIGPRKKQVCNNVA